MYRLLLILFLTGCGYNRFDPAADSPTAWAPTASIASLTEGRVARTEVVEGTATTGDSAGNFYKEVLLEEKGAVLRVSVGLYDLYALAPQGSTAAVRLDEGNWLVRGADGVLTATIPANFNGLKIHRQPYVLEWSVPVVTLDQISKIASGRTVRIVGCRFAAGGTGAVYSGEAAVEQDAASAKLTTSPYASFAQEKLPAGRFDLRAVVLDGKLKISDPLADLTLW